VILKDLLTRNKNQIDLKDDINYKQVTVRMWNKGVCLRNEILGSDIKSAKRYLVSKGQFIISKIDARHGAFGMIPEELEGAVITGDFLSYNIDSSKILPDYFYWFFSQKKFIELCARTSSGTTNRIRLKEDKFLEIPIELPSLDQQQKELTKILNIKQIMLSCEDNTKNNSTYIDKLHQAILSEAVQGKLVPQDPNDEPASILLKKIKAEKEKLINEKKIRKEKPLPEIKEEEIPYKLPKGWAWVRLGQLIQVAENLDIQKKRSPNTIINYVDIDSIDNNKHIIKSPKSKKVSELSTRARRVLLKGQILYSLVRPYLNNIAFVENNLENQIGSTGFVAFKPILIQKKYIYYYLLSPHINKLYLDLLKGFNSPSITHEQFQRTTIPIPPLKEQKRIIKKTDQLMLLCDQLGSQVKANQKNSEALMNSVLREAFDVET